MYRKKPEDKLSMWNITIKIDGKKIEPSSHVKYLGILIDSILNWNFHIDELSTKLSQILNLTSLGTPHAPASAKKLCISTSRENKNKNI